MRSESCKTRYESRVRAFSAEGPRAGLYIELSPRCPCLRGSFCARVRQTVTSHRLRYIPRLLSGMSDCSRGMTPQQGLESRDKDIAGDQPYLTTSDEATPVTRSIASGGGTTTSSSTRHAPRVEDQRERAVALTDNLPCSVLTEFLLSYCADSALMSNAAVASDVTRHPAKGIHSTTTGNHTHHRGVQKSISEETKQQ